MRALVLIACVGSCLLVVAPSTSEAIAHGRIVFEATHAVRPAGLSTVDPTGGHRTWIVKGRYPDRVVVAPDGGFAFDAGDDLYVGDSRATKRILGRRARGGAGTPVAFSPDSKTLVVRSSAGWDLRDRATGALRLTLPAYTDVIGWTGSSVVFLSGDEIHVIAVDGTGDHVVARGGWGAVSPNGTWIAYPGAAAGEVRVVRSDGSADHRLGACDTFVWSPDSSQLACNSLAGNTLVFLGLDGAVRPTNAASCDDTIVWSPDGLQLACFAQGHKLVFVGVDGSVRSTNVRSVADGDWSPDSARFAFTDTDEDNTGFIAVADPATGVVRRVVDGVGPEWSPDGGRLLVREGGRGTGVVAAVGGPIRTVADSDDSAWWLPGGGLLIRVSELATEQLATISPAGGPLRYLRGTAGDIEPAWSPGGRRLAFAVGLNEFTWSIGICDADGSHRRLAVSEGRSPDWSPDGRRIAYAGRDGIYVVRANGGSRRLVTRAREPWTVSWSPDGTMLAFGDVVGDSRRIELIDTDGRHRRVIVAGYWVQGGIAWSPDGTELAFAKGSPADDTPRLFLARIRDRRQSGLGYHGSSPSWSPDGTRLVFTDEDNRIEVIGLGSPGHEHLLAQGAVGSDAKPSWSRH